MFKEHAEIVSLAARRAAGLRHVSSAYERAAEQLDLDRRRRLDLERPGRRALPRASHLEVWAEYCAVDGDALGGSELPDGRARDAESDGFGLVVVVDGLGLRPDGDPALGR